MRYFQIIAFVLIGFASYGQKEVKTIIDAESIRSILISTDEVFEISITTAPVETITIKSQANGEYYNDIGIKTKVKQKKLILTSRFRKKLLDGFDKLSTHRGFR